ncbi:MAG: 3D domain-containing protein [Verrucomicrobiota bacterium]|nr:3D domain-containing protein [Verrucomicrobiota bacterium]
MRTTAYTHTEADHRQYGRQTALGTRLQSGLVKSAAADWSRWPSGTIFRIQETGETFEVDDYGWALAGTNTIDLYKPSRAAMNAWGTRRVHLEVLQWGDPWQSHAILHPRRKYAHVKRMASQIETRYRRGEGIQPDPGAAEASPRAIAMVQPVTLPPSFPPVPARGTRAAAAPGPPTSLGLTGAKPPGRTVPVLQPFNAGLPR